MPRGRVVSSWFAFVGLAVALAACGGGSVVGTSDASDIVSVVDVAAREAAVDTGPQCAASEAVCDGRCVDTQSDARHCGACGAQCPAGQACAMGACRVVCPAGQTVCDGQCVSTATSNAHCGACGAACPAGTVCSMGRCALTCAAPLTLCSPPTASDAGAMGDDAGGADAGGPAGPYCADTRVDATNCGACGAACPPGQSCVASRCTVVCPTGQTDCGGTCRDTQTDRFNCGACGTTCPAGQVCQGGACALSCMTGLTNCMGSCRDLQTDNAHCGACGTACPAGQVCAGGACRVSCGAGLTDCMGSCRDLQTDRAHCGACGTRCGTAEVCSMGACALECAAPLTACGGGGGGAARTCVDTRNDPAHCGACGAACAARPNSTGFCSAGACRYLCNAGFADCNGMPADGCEVALGTDVRNCGVCGRACSAANGAAACTAGVCGITCNAGFADCDRSVANGCEAAVGGACTPTALCRRGVTACGPSAPVCMEAGNVPAGTSCGANMVCNATGGCVACTQGAACDTGNPCTAGVIECGSGTPVCRTTGPRPANTGCGTNRVCNPSGTCVDSVLSAAVTCPARTLTGHQLCQAAGFARATSASGYWWGQCGGTLDRCPGGWQGDGTSCPNWCPGTDCVGVGFCSGAFGWTVRTRSGDGGTAFNALDFGYDCSSWNPGWTVRVRCAY